MILLEISCSENPNMQTSNQRKSKNKILQISNKKSPL
jgi:hypothetical protein